PIESIQYYYRGQYEYEIQIEYIHIWKYYEEDMTDISDWEYDSSAGLVGDEYGFYQDNGYAYLSAFAGGSEDEWVMYKTPMNYLITPFTRFETNHCIGIDNYPNVQVTTRISGIGLDIQTSLTESEYPEWEIQNTDLSVHTGKIIDWLYVKIDDIPNAPSYGMIYGFWDYIKIYEIGGSLSTSIPTKQFIEPKLEFMIDTDNLADTTQLEFGIYQNNEPMNYQFYLENKTFT
ncbi:unnamed protein product, partial [marine sediment metagenome]